MKKIDWHITRSFAPPFAATFCITLFVLIMQFLWKYVDDLVGKGLEWYIVLKLLFFASASLVPLAVPLAVLLASLMTVGDLAEHYEITSFKSAGIPLSRIFLPLIIVSLIISASAWAFSNYVLPVANLKFGSLLYDIRQQKPAVDIHPGEFYNEIDGYSILVGSKDADNRTIHDVIIYDHTGGRNNENVTTATQGQMYLTADKRYLVLQLSNGHQYQEVHSQTSPPNSHELVRTSFQSWKKNFDLSEFNLTFTDENLFKDNYMMQNLRQLRSSIDTFHIALTQIPVSIKRYCATYFTFCRRNLDSIYKANGPMVDTSSHLADSSYMISTAMMDARNITGYLTMNGRQQASKTLSLNKYEVEWQRKFSLSFACFVLFLIGAPLGALIRKGGFGLPFVISVFFFVLFYILSIIGEKMATQSVVSAAVGMWAPTFILLPLGVFLMYKASRDMSLVRSQSLFLRISRKLKLTGRPESEE